ADVRLSTTLKGHPKMTKLQRRLQTPAGPLGIIYLWMFAAAEKPDGDLTGMTDEDIEIAAGWDGEPGAFVRAASEVRFLDGEPGAYKLHDWAEHQPWAVGAEDRSESAKWAALCKRYGRAGAAERMPEYAKRMRPAREPDAPRTRPARAPAAEPVRAGRPDTVSVRGTVPRSGDPPRPPAPHANRMRPARDPHAPRMRNRCGPGAPIPSPSPIPSPIPETPPAPPPRRSVVAPADRRSARKRIPRASSGSGRRTRTASGQR